MSQSSRPPSDSDHSRRDERSRRSDVPSDRTLKVSVHGTEDDSSGFVVRTVPAPRARSDELATSSRKQLRRQRDRRAEGRAIQVLVGLFVGIGGLGLLAVNVLLDDAPSPTAAPRSAGAEASVAEAPAAGTSAAGTSAADSAKSAASAAQAPKSPPAVPDNVISSPLVERVDLPALRQLRYEGLTIAAEGLPEVTTAATGPTVGPLAARETCRFAYGIWEFSPNKRFRFISTCRAFEGQVLFGAYSVHGGAIRMSPLRVSGVAVETTFEVEKPSRLVTRVTVGADALAFTVRQRVTVIRSGLFGDAFFNTYAAKNTLAVPDGSAPAAGRRNAPTSPKAPNPKTEPPAERGPKDPLLELLRGTKKP